MRCSVLRVVVSTALAALLSEAETLRTDSSPVTRVVTLLKGLADKIEEEASTEETVYKKFACWGKSTIDGKTASNTAAASRIETLKTYIADIDAGRIEFTTERVDLEKELKELNGELETSAALRARENKDFEEAKDEMEKGILALEDAIKVLSEATRPVESGLLSMKTEVVGSAARVAQAAALAHAVDLGDRVLSKGDARFLRRLLTGEVPVPDWKKLNRKATFKESYKARSGKIQAVLAKLLSTFQANLADATTKEQEAQSLFDQLTSSKTEQKNSVETSLSTMEKEGSARALSRGQASEEVSDLEQQVQDDNKYITQVQQSLDAKKLEWEARSKLRSEELAAISQAIAVLHSDDARDLFKRSFASQGYALLQTGSSTDAMRRKKATAASILRSAASSDARLVSLAAFAERTRGGNFVAVIKAIDDMVALLEKEEAKELKQKEGCESDRASDVRAAATASRAADELKDTQTRLEHEIDEIKATVADKRKEIEKINEDVSAATRIREDEAKEFAAVTSEDKEAVVLIEQAHGILQSFYSSNGLMLLSQGHRSTQQSVSQAPGEAPTPPPATWEGTYQGKTDESSGILAILMMIKNDILSDIAKAESGESAAIASFGELTSDLASQVSDLQAAILSLEDAQSRKEGEVQTTIGEQSMKLGELQVTMDKIRAAEPGCNFLAVNYVVRTKNRQLEIDGLAKAKAILSGADFSTQGSAFLAQHREKQ